MVGPLARLNLNAEKLRPRAAELLPKVCKTVGKMLPWRNNYFSLLARGLETVHALELAADLLGNYVPPVRARVPIVPRAGIGGHGTEAPRGICWHEYRSEADGTIVSARIIPPTSQNYATIEADLRALAPQVVELPDEDAALRCEHLIRNYDPCISCSVHFLKLLRRGHKAATGGHVDDRERRRDCRPRLCIGRFDPCGRDHEDQLCRPIPETRWILIGTRISRLHPGSRSAGCQGAISFGPASGIGPRRGGPFRLYAKESIGNRGILPLRFVVRSSPHCNREDPSAPQTPGIVPGGIPLSTMRTPGHTSSHPPRGP